MRNSAQFLTAAALCIALCTANAQTRLIPIAELVNVPVSLATPKEVTPEQLRAAVIAAALAAQWDVDPQADGTLKLTYFKDLNYRIVMRAELGPKTYSLRYVDSENMSSKPMNLMPPTANGVEPLEVAVKKWRVARSARSPDYPHAVDRTDAVIHHDYEALVYELSAGVRRHLRLL